MDLGIKGRRAFISASSQGLGLACADALCSRFGERRRLLVDAAFVARDRDCHGKNPQSGVH